MNRRFLLFLTLMTAFAAKMTAFDPSVYATESKLASGKWVKISTDSEGIFQLTYSQLEELGFSNPEKVQVYGVGGVALTALNNTFKSDFPDDVTPVATYHTSDGRILFFGQSDAYIRSNYSKDYSQNSDAYFTKVRNPYDTASYYFLSDAFGAVEIPVMDEVALSSADPIKSHIHVDFIEPELQNISNGGAIFHGNKYRVGEKASYTFAIKNFAPTKQHANGSFYYKFGVTGETRVSLEAELPEELTKVSSNKSDAAIIYNDGTTSFNEATGCITFSDPQITPGTEVEYTFSVNIASGSPSYCAEDFVMIRYPRANRIDSQSPFIVMNFPNKESKSGQKVEFVDVDGSDLEVWSLDGYTPKAFKTYYDEGESPSIILNGSNLIAVAFCPSMTFPSPEIVGEIDNQNIHGTLTPDMLIITVADQVAEANQIAELHRRFQGMDVLVLVHDDIYNEFSSGTREAMAYRRLAKMFYDRDPNKFKHLMFFGPAFYDNRCITGNKVDRLVCYEQDIPTLCNSFVTNYAADAYFAMLDDNYRHDDIHTSRTQINVGRVSTVTSSQAATYVAKVKDRFENPLPAEVYNHILLTAGPCLTKTDTYTDYGTHSKQAKEIYTKVRNEINPAISFSQVHCEVFNTVDSKVVNNAMTAALNRGAGMMTYIGHGSPTSIATWSTSQVGTNPYTYAPFVMFSSCDQYSFDHLSNGLVETMIHTEKGGALGGVAASRSVYIEQNQKTCLPVCVAYAGAKPGDTYGDIFRRSREIILDSLATTPSAFPQKNTTFRNILSYNLAGDPALPIGVPDYAASITTVNGNEVSSDLISINPFEEASISGVVLSDGNIADDFNGSVKIEILDGVRTIKTIMYANVSGYEATEVPMDNEVLAIMYGEVVNGRFSVKSSIPTPAYISDTYRIIVSASSDKGKAIGMFDRLAIGDFDPDTFEENEFKQPVIKSFYADDPSFTSGSEIAVSTTIHAIIDPSESGLNVMTGNVNSRTRILVDDINPTTNLEGFISRRDDNTLELAVPMKDLSEGLHTIELTVVNNAGLLDRQTIEVIVSDHSLQPEIFVAESPAVTSATIDISEAAEYSRLIITDSNGETVLSVENPSFPYKWILDKEGSEVKAGLYNASVLVNNGSRYGASPSAKITVLR